MRATFLKVTKGMASLTVLATTIFLVAGCTPTNQLPSITSLQAERESIPPSGSCRIEHIASAKDKLSVPSLTPFPKWPYYSDLQRQLI